MRDGPLLALLLSVSAIADSPSSAHALYQAGHYAQAQTRSAQEGGYAGKFGAGCAAT